MNREEDNYHRKVEDYALKLGFSLFGVADLRGLEETLVEFSPERIAGLDRAVSLAVRLSDAVLDEIGDRPTRLYLHHYRQANYFLDRNAFELARFLQEMGARALPIAASQTVDWVEQKGHLSHKEVARRAGLGWIGRNNLLVSPRWGARIRLVTVLTDLPLRIDRPLPEGCGRCRECIPACPGGAIAEKREDFDHRKCFEQLKLFKNGLNLGHYICGLCVKACRPEGTAQRG